LIPKLTASSLFIPKSGDDAGLVFVTYDMENYIMVCESDNSVHIVVDVITGKYYRVDIRRDVHEQLLEKYNILFQENYPMLMREYPEIKA
jgi:hypothetical protein